MATRKETIEPILDAIRGATVRRMFGEYAIYLDGKVLGFICDDTLFLKNLPEAQDLLADAELGEAYPGSKLYIIADPWLDEPDVLARAACAIADALPPPKPKSKKRQRCMNEPLDHPP
jgi:TfoX/Sxy family transcriptional regulator of competence genes